MTKSFGEATNTPETDQQAVTRLLEARLSPFEWEKWGGRLSWLGNGTIREGKFIFFGGAYESPTFSETRVTRYRRNQPEAVERHTFGIGWDVGVDSEGRTSALSTHYEVDLLSGELRVFQLIGANWTHERAASFPHFGIQNAQPPEQWHQLRELLETWK